MKGLNIETECNKIIIKFPASIITYIFCVAVIPLFIIFFILWLNVLNPFDTNSFRYVVALILWISIVILSPFPFLLLFLRKLTIDIDTKKVVYFSVFKKVFNIGDIVSMDTKIDVNSDGPDGYSLIIRTKDCKKIKIKTQSDKQSQMLYSQLLLLQSNQN